MSRLRIGIASQTPYVRRKSTSPPLDDAVSSLRQLRRGIHYSVTPGGVSRMIGSLLRAPGFAEQTEGAWVTLKNGLPNGLRHGGFRLLHASLAADQADGYKAAKEVVWEAINGLSTRIQDPLDPAHGPTLGAFEAWSRASAQVLIAEDALEPFDVFYVNDWQHLPQANMLPAKPRVVHFHAPFADWTPQPWKEFLTQRLGRFDEIIVSTHSFARELAKAGIERPLHVVHPWLDLQDFQPSRPSIIEQVADEYGLPEDDDVILHVGRMDPIKGQDRLIRAFAHVARRRPRVRLVLVGNGSFSSSSQAGMGMTKGTQWRSHLEALVQELKLGERVQFAGHVAHARLWPLVQRANAFAFPSTGEGFGLAVAEAWLARKPVVVSTRAGIAELVREGRNGFAVETTDSLAFAGALLRALKAPDSVGQQGYEAAATHCDVRQAVPRILSILSAARMKPESSISAPPFPLSP